MRALPELYRFLPEWGQDAAITAYGAKLRWQRHGQIHRKQLAALLQSQWSSRAELEANQLASLQMLVTGAYRSVPYFRQRGPAPTLASLADIRAIPTMSKADVRTAGFSLLSMPAHRLLQVHTGGSTGTPLTVYCERDTLQRNYAFFERLKRWAKIPQGGRIATFAGRNLMDPTARGRVWRRNWAANTMLFSSYHISPQSVSLYVDALADFKPDLIDSYPSSIEPIARHVLASGDTRVRPTAIITSSETLFPETRALLERAFECRVFDHYGSAEMVAFISQCEAGSYHVNPEFGLVELLRDGDPVALGETGEIVATGFINPAMPLIRYAMGDSASWSDRPCDCGRAYPVIEQIEGRIDDVVITPDGRRIGRLDPIFKATSGIHESRIVQDAPDHLTVETVTAGGLPAEQQAVLLDELQKRLGPQMRIDFRSVAQLPRTARGKVRSVVSLLGGNDAP